MLAGFIVEFEKQSSINQVISNEGDASREENQELRANPRVDRDSYQGFMEFRE